MKTTEMSTPLTSNKNSVENNSSNPLVSIVLVSYNQAEYLREAITSILSQDYSPIEFIIMDGGSSDGSEEIIQEYRDELAYCNIGPDGGAAPALNAGFKVAKGDIFAYLNSDDVLLPHTVSVWVKAFQKSKADIVYGDIRIIDSQGKDSHLPGKKVSLFKAAPFTLRRLAAGGCIIPQQASAWKREVHEKIGGFVESNKSCWDGEFFTEAGIHRFRFYRVSGVLALFRVHSNSISGTGKHAEARKIDHSRIRQKWLDAGFKISPIEKWFWVKSGQALRAMRYILETEK